MIHVKAMYRHYVSPRRIPTLPYKLPAYSVSPKGNMPLWVSHSLKWTPVHLAPPWSGGVKKQLPLCLIWTAEGLWSGESGKALGRFFTITENCCCYCIIPSLHQMSFHMTGLQCWIGRGYCHAAPGNRQGVLPCCSPCLTAPSSLPETGESMEVFPCHTT